MWLGLVPFPSPVHKKFEYDRTHKEEDHTLSYRKLVVYRAEPEYLNILILVPLVAIRMSNEYLNACYFILFKKYENIKCQYVNIPVIKHIQLGP